MTKRKNVVSKMLLLVLILTLISCCFLGSTFARYTTGGSGTGTMEVAKWDISNTHDETDVSFKHLSPAMEGPETPNRSNKTARIRIATITNSGDVDALVTITVDGKTLTKAADAAEYGTNGGVPSEENPTQVQVEEVFEITLYKGNTDTKISANEELAKGTSLEIYAVVTWKTDVTDGLSGANADIRDTWIGENIESVQWTISYTVVQNSILSGEDVA